MKLPWEIVVCVLALGYAALSASSEAALITNLVAVVLLLVPFLFLARRIVKALRPKTYGGLTRTERGDVVRSRSERAIADYFLHNGIDYVYEREARSRSRRRISRPDFYLPDYGVYVEYWGLLNADDAKLRADYERTMKWKMAQYHRNGIRFVSLYPKDMDDLERVFPAKLREAAGLDVSKRRSMWSRVMHR